jgi:predicted MFS family arabinose efflux permease
MGAGLGVSRGRAGVRGVLAGHVDALAVGGVVLGLSAIAFMRVPLLPYLGEDLSMTAAELGLFTTVFALGRLATDVPAGRLSDRRRESSILAAAAALLGGTSLVVATAQTAWLVLVTAFFLGVSSALVNTTGMVFFAQRAPAHRRGRSMAGFSAALLGGQALGPAVGGLLGTWWDWRVALAVGGGLGLLMSLGLLLGGRRARPRVREEVGPSTGGAAAPVPLRERVILYFVPFAVFFALGAMPQTLLPIIGATDFELTAGVIGVVLGVGGLCRFVGAMVGGTVSDRVSRKAALVPALLVQAAGVALLLWEGRLWAWVAAVILMSIASFSVSVAATMLVDHARGRRSGRRLGPFRFIGDVGLITGPLGASLVYQHLGQRWAALLVVGVLLLAGLASALGLRETRRLSGPTDLGAEA